MVKHIKVSEIAAASPDMDEAQFNELLNDIRHRGQLVPIWTLRGEVIDGRKRLRACQILGIEPNVIEMVHVADVADGADVAHSLNILRTHYTATQRAMFAAKMANLKIGDVKSQRNQAVATVSHQGTPLMSNKQAADLVGIKPRSINRAKSIRLHASPEVCRAVEMGEMSARRAEAIMRLPEDRQAEAITNTIVRKQDALGRLQPIQKGTFKASPKRPLDGRIIRTLDQLDNAIELIGQFLDEDGCRDHPDYPKWVKHLYAARTRLGRTLKKHGGENDTDARKQQAV